MNEDIDTGDIIFQVIGGATDTQFEVNAASAPEIDMVLISNTAQGTVTTGANALQIDFVTGNGTNPTNSGIEVNLTSGGTAAGDIILGLNLTMDAADASTQRGVNFADNNFDTDINALTDLTLGIGGTNELTLTATDLSPSTSDGSALGTGTLMWGDLFLASGGVINFNNGRMGLLSAMAREVTNGTFVLTTNTGHFVQREDPALVIWAIRRVLAALP